MQYIGLQALFAGERSNRERVKTYIKLLFADCRRAGRESLFEAASFNEELSSREDVTVLPIPSDCVGYVTGNRRQALTDMEKDYGKLFIFTEFQRVL